MNRRAIAAAAAGACCFFSLPTQAAIMNFTAFLSPANEVPAVTNAPDATAGAGIIFQFDTTSNNLSWTIAFEGLTVPPSGAPGATGAHFHSGAPGFNGPIEINLDTGANSDSSPGNDLDAQIALSGIGSTSGLFQGNGPLSAAQETDLMLGNFYVNIHTTLNPGGELRGQVLEAQVIPVPAAAWLFGSGLLGMVAVARRKKAA